MKTFVPWAALALVLGFASAARAEHPLTKRYLAGLFKAKPHLATFMGDHRFDGALPDLSPVALRARERELAAAVDKASGGGSPSVDDQIDLAASRILGSSLPFLRP